MGGAMLAGWLASGLSPSRFTILDPQLGRAPEGVSLVANVAALNGHEFEAVLLGIKPQLIGDVAPALAPLCGPATTVFSILAGVEVRTLARLLPQARALVRIMPNLAAALGKSPVALFGSGLDDPGRSAVTALMAPLGAPEWLEDEGLFNAVTALVGSGPAFVYRFIDALAAAGAALGLETRQAERLAMAMAEGAALLAAASPDSPGALARKVASPGGTTEAGLEVLDADQAMVRLVDATLRAAAARGAELAAAARR
ncbi:MAG: pyrroline-5-carboxylate reductase dimerization domain-containing protein [Novosphingobium sp.]